MEGALRKPQSCLFCHCKSGPGRRSQNGQQVHRFLRQDASLAWLCNRSSYDYVGWRSFIEAALEL